MPRSTRHLFDGMPKRIAASGNDLFGNLTDDLLRHVLSFLPQDDALQTCVLGTRWRDHWRRTTSLDFHVDEPSCFPRSGRFEQLAKLIIHLRGDSPFDKCEIDATPDDELGSTYTTTMLLIEYALNCQVKELLVRASAGYYVEDPRRLDAPLISQHLKTMHLDRVNLERSALNFSRCPVLEDLKMQRCSIDARRMSSKSLKRLCITDLCSFPLDFHIRIFAPGLISLQLDDYSGLTPSLEYMPSLVTAYVRVGDKCYDFCRCIGLHFMDDECSCHSYPIDEGLLLHGLSNTVNLDLVAGYKIEMKLVRATGTQETIEQSFLCAHLQVVNIECREVDEGICEILKTLSTCGISRRKIRIKDLCSRSDCFSFQKPLPLVPSTATPVAAVSTTGGT